MPDQFISEPIKPVAGTLDTKRMTAGEPGLPSQFQWKKETIIIDQVLRSWRETKKCRSGSSEIYVRKHWYEAKTTSNTVIKVYFDRQPNSGPKGMGWWLYSIRECGAEK